MGSNKMHIWIRNCIEIQTSLHSIYKICIEIQIILKIRIQKNLDWNLGKICVQIHITLKSSYLNKFFCFIVLNFEFKFIARFSIPTELQLLQNDLRFDSRELMKSNSKIKFNKSVEVKHRFTCICFKFN